VRKVLLLSGFLLSLYAFEDLGVWGETYEIDEPDFVKTMEVLGRDLNRTKIVAEAKESLAKQMHVERFVPVCGKSDKRIYEPLYTLEHDIVLPDGTVLYKKGYTFNVLARLKESGRGFSKYVVFVDADDPAQQAIAKYYKNGATVVAVAGNIRNLTKMGVYAFRADKNLVEHFGVRCAPSVYVQRGERFEITEIDPKDLEKGEKR